LLQFRPEKPISNVVGYIRDKSILDHVNPHANAPCLIKFDLKDFFPTIKVRHVTKIFIDLGYTIRVSRTLAGLVTMDGHLPQGAATSPQISNIFMEKFDRDLATFCNGKDFSLTRYADDIVISGNELLLNQIEDIQEIFYRHKLVINSSKTRIYRRPHDIRFITGLMLREGKVRLPKAMRRQIRSEAFALTKELEGFANGFTHRQKKIGLWADPVFIDRTIGKLNYWEFVDPTDCYPRLMRENIKVLLEKFN
jgi:retron-type reverse transcriptase